MVEAGKRRTIALFTAGLTKDNINELISINKGLIGSQLIAFNLADDQDAISMGYEGLHSAILNFNPSAGTSFSTYATVCIKNSIRQALRNKKDKIDIVSLEVLSVGEEPKIEFATLSEEVIYNAIACVLANTAPSSRAILEVWVDSDFTLLNRDIADIADVSQPYVNKVINTFRQQLREKLKEVL